MFGNAPPAASAPSAGLFGNAGTPATTTTATTTAAGTSLFAPAQATPAQGAAVAGATTAAKHSAATSAAALELNGLTIEEIVTKWSKALQVHVDKFQDAAEQVRARDVVLLENQKSITRLAKEAQVLKASHAELRSQLDMVSELLFDLHAALEQLEGELGALEKQQPGAQDSADAQRGEAYDLAVRMDAEVEALQAHVRGIVEQLNRVRGPGTGSSVALRILNNNHTSLEWLDKATLDLRSEIALASGLLEQ